jgi:cytochrome b involved in lipid metabolism
VIHNKQYDLTQFIPQHPGGEHWIENTRGQDITELFHTHHLNEAKATALLNKYYIADCKKSFTRFTFKPDGYYETLKRKLLSKYSADELQDNTQSKLLTFKILGLFLVCFLITCYTRSYLMAALSGFILVSVVGEGHNFMHQRVNPFRHVFGLTGFTHEDWQNFHAISHHMFPNTELDYEIGVFEPISYALRNRP